MCKSFVIKLLLLCNMIQVSILFRNNVHKEHPSTIKIGYFTTWREKFQHGFLGSSRKSEMSADTCYRCSTFAHQSRRKCRKMSGTNEGTKQKHYSGKKCHHNAFLRGPQGQTIKIKHDFVKPIFVPSTCSKKSILPYLPHASGAQ